MIKNYTRQKFKLSYFVRIKNSNLACPQASRCKAYQTSQIKYVKASQGNSREISIYIYIYREKKEKEKGSSQIKLSKMSISPNSRMRENGQILFSCKKINVLPNFPN